MFNVLVERNLQNFKTIVTHLRLISVISAVLRDTPGQDSGNCQQVVCADTTRNEPVKVTLISVELHTLSSFLH